MTGIEITAAYTMDAMLGDPRTWPHPVRLLGRSIKASERLIRQVAHSERGLQAGGVLLAVTLPLLVWAATWGLITGATHVSPWLGTLTALYLAYTTLAARDLQDHALAVSSALERQDLPAARDALSLIVGRETEKLEEPEVIRATVETVAENASDGVIAPLLFLAVGGAPLAMAYKAVNTLDSMIGYRDSRYQTLGWGSARLDDVLNFIPARLSGLLLVVAAFIWRCRGKAAWRIMCRDGHQHPSPNSGVPEAAMAGALGVQLGGMNYYHGVLHERPLIGDAISTRERRHIRVSVKLAWTASFLVLVMILVAKAL